MKVQWKQPRFQIGPSSSLMKANSIFSRDVWTFCGTGETRQDRKFLLSKDVFPLVVDALLLQPPLLEDTGQTDIARKIIDINESALGPFGA